MNREVQREKTDWMLDVGCKVNEKVDEQDGGLLDGEATEFVC